MPSATPRAIAAFIAVLREPPRLKLATAGVPAAWLATAQSMPAITPDVAPDPEQLSTRIATSDTPLATPHVAPPIVPAT